MKSVAERANQLFDKYNAPGSPGCALAVIREGDIIHCAAFGLASIELNAPINPNSVFNIGSESKQFTAMAILLLAKEGKLALDDDARGYFPEFPDFKEVVTIRQLLTHTAGVRCSFPPLLTLGEWNESDYITNKTVLDLLKAQRELNFRPGDEFSYSNLGYIALAEIVALVSGMPFADFCRERIFRPLGMTNTTVYADSHMVLANRVEGYYPNGEGGFLNDRLTDSVLGPTNVYTSVEDLARWDENFYTGQVGGLAVVEQMHERAKLNDGRQLDYAMGLFISQYRGLRMVKHGGSHGGYTAGLVRFPDQHLSVILLCNFFNWETESKALEVADIYLEEMHASLKSAPVSQELQAMPDVKVGEDTLRTMEGLYFDPVRVALRQVSLGDDGKLRVKGFAVLPIGENTFVYEGLPESRLRVWPATSRVPARIQILSQTTDYIYERVEAVSLTPEELGAYTGCFYSPELDIYWTVLLHEGQLFVRRRKYANTPLKPVFKDAFVDDWTQIVGYPNQYTIIFEQEGSGELASFRVSGDRARHVKFFKATPPPAYHA